MKFVFFLSILLSVTSIYAQDAKSVLKKMSEKYKSINDYELTSNYELFKGHASNDVIERYSSLSFKNGTNYYQKISNTEMIYTNSFFIKINHQEKAVLLDKPNKSLEINAELEKSLSHCSETKLNTTESYYEVILWIKNTSEIPYSLIKIHISKKDYTLLQMDLYYSYQEVYTHKNEEKEYFYPHVRIKYGKMNQKPKIDKSIFKFEKYILTNNRILTLNEKFAGYSFHDVRTKS